MSYQQPAAAKPNASAVMRWGTERWGGLEAEEDWGQQPGLAGNLTTNSSSSCAYLLGDKEHLAWDKRNPGAAAWERKPSMVLTAPYPLPLQPEHGQSPPLILVSVGCRLDSSRECLDSSRSG